MSILLLIGFIGRIITALNIPDYEIAALKDLYDATNGTFWNWRETIQWNFSQPSPNPCEEQWYGITCTNDSVMAFVEEINLDTMTLKGYIPPSLGNFTKLVQLSLETNYLRSSIPPQLGQLSNLEVLNLAMNELTGTIPPELANCQNLSDFDVFFNSIVGSVPNSFSTLSKMFSFQITHNFFTGDVEYAANWTNVVYFVVSENLLNATIPDFFCHMERLTDLGLENNHFHGTMPTCWKTESVVYMITVENNDLTGTLPKELANLPVAISLALGFNKFHGRIPDEYMTMSGLPSLLLRYNDLTGPIPVSISNMTSLNTIDFSGNKLTGWIPQDLGKLGLLSQLLLQENYLSGPIPDLSTCPLTFLRVQENGLTGPLPESITESLTMYTLQAFNNHLTGPMPAGLKNDQRMTLLDVSGNQLTGSIFSGIGNIHILSQCFLNDNLLTGSIPSGLARLSSLIVLLLNNNLLSGSLPSLERQLSAEQIFLYSNMFTGPITHVFNCSTQQKLMYIDVSDNQLTSKLPEELFSCPKLKSFAALSNCFSGPLPVEMCGASNLTSLVLDGLMSANSCQRRFFKNFEAVVSYGLTNSIPDGIPECLFTLPLLETLHLSGNGLTGTLSKDLALSPSLVDLSLSHNSLRGEIPLSLRFHHWDQLDLSYNKITGTFEETLRPAAGKDHFAFDNTSLSLKVNRLSGKIPAALKYLDSISILDGNIFECDTSRSSLPPSDPNYQIYSCGSNSFNDSIYLWCAVMSCAILASIVLWLLKMHGLSDTKLDGSSVSDSVSQLWRQLLLWMSVFRKHYGSQDHLVHLKSFGVFVTGIRKVVVWLTVFIVCILLPTYVALSEYYDTYTFEYAWGVSGAYLSGVAPAVVLFFLLLIFGLCCVVLLFVHCKRIVYAFAAADSNIPMTKKWLHSAGLMAVVTWNMILVTGVNIAYVYIDHHYSSAVVQITQVFVALFKVTWNNFIVQYVLERQDKDYAYESEIERLSMSENELHRVSQQSQAELNDSIRNTDDAVVVMVTVPPTSKRNQESYTRGIGLAVFVMLFNNIAAPFIATGYVSSNCFYDIVTSPEEVSVTYAYAQCSAFSPHGNVTACVGYDSVAYNKLGYFPPFLYSYQCASTFITTYANIFILMLTIDSFFIPLLMWLTKLVHDRLSARYQSSSLVLQLVKIAMPLLLMPISAFNNTKGLKLFPCDVFVVKLINIFGVLCTFGAILPPVAVICCVAVFSVTYHAQVLLGRFVYNVRRTTTTSRDSFGRTSDSSSSRPDKLPLDPLSALLDRDCEGAVNMFLSGVHIIVPFAAIFFGLVLFDTLGDAVGWQRALVVPLLICTMPLVVYIRRCLKSDSMKSYGRSFGSKVSCASRDSGVTYSYVHQTNSPQYAPLLDEPQERDLSSTL